MPKINSKKYYEFYGDFVQYVSQIEVTALERLWSPCYQSQSDKASRKRKSLVPEFVTVCEESYNRFDRLFLKSLVPRLAKKFCITDL